MRGGVPWAKIGWLYLLVLWLTWTPTGGTTLEVQWLPPRLGWRSLLGNLLLFAPIGAVFAAGHLRSAIGPSEGRRTVVAAGLLGAILSGVVELGQLFIPGRSTSPYDVLMNGAGAAAAAWVVTTLIRAGVRTGVVARGVVVLVFVAVLVFTTSTALTGSRMVRLFQWSAEYSVLAGDEVGGGREYQGLVLEPEICVGRGEGRLCLEPGAGLQRRALLIQSAHSRQEASLSARVTSEGAQPSDARIVTFSQDVYHRNATLFQRDRDLILRLRTPASGPNATEYAFLMPGIMEDGRPIRVNADYRSYLIRMEVSGGEERRVARFPLGFLSGWWVARDVRTPLVEAHHLLLATLAAGLVLSVPLGLVLTSWTGVPAGVGLLGGAIVAPGFLFLVAEGLRIPLSPEDLVATIAFGLLGASLGLIDRRRRHNSTGTPSSASARATFTP